MLRATGLVRGTELLLLRAANRATGAQRGVVELVASHLGSVPRVLGKEEEEAQEQRVGEEWTGRRVGTEGGSKLRVVCSNPKTAGNWVIVPLIHLITGQSSSLAC